MTHDDMITIEQHRITLTFPGVMSWDDLRKELKPRVDLAHAAYEREQSEKRKAEITAAQAAR
jgi:hypothetical protein